MYLSQIVLSLDDCFQYGIRNDYAIHQLVVSLFPYGKERYLYYVDRSVSSYLRIIVQSSSEPVAPAIGRFLVKDIKSSFFEHEMYRFRVRVSPVTRHNGKASRILYGDKAEDWFIAKTASAGFSVNRNSLEESGSGIMKMKDNNNNLVVIHYIDFTGLLEVSDKKLFLEKAVVNGIGSAKGFGCGLLQLSPIRNK